MSDVDTTQLSERQKEMLQLLMELSEEAGNLKRQIYLLDEILEDAYNKGMVAGAAAIEAGHADIIPRHGRYKRHWHTDPNVMG